MAFCHLFVHDDDFFRLRSLSYTDSLDKNTIKKFLLQIFHVSEQDVLGTQAKPRLCFIEIEKLEKFCDMRRSVMYTLLSYIMMFESKPLTLFPSKRILSIFK